MGLRILITNNTLGPRAGSELFVRDLATALLDRGHTPIVFSTRLGPVAAELHAATVPVIDRLSLLAEPPDIIHGHHHFDSMMALQWFSRTPAIYFCHGWLPWEEAPPRHPRIRRYLAVDETCRDRLECAHGIPRRSVDVLLNFVDLRRFQPRRPLPAVPRRALILSNQAQEGGWVAAIREACTRRGMQLDVRGLASGQPLDRPEEVLGAYDVVFAKARAALEAMAVGTAVILCDAVGAGPLVTMARFDTLRPLNFGVRTLQQPQTVEHFLEQLALYDPVDAAEVCRRVRQSASRDAVVERLIQIYHMVIDAHRTEATADPERESREVSEYLRWLAPRAVDLHDLHTRIARLTAENASLLQQGELRDDVGRAGAHGRASNGHAQDPLQECVAMVDRPPASIRPADSAAYRRAVEAESAKWGSHLAVEASQEWHAWLDHPLVLDNYRRHRLVDGKSWQEFVRCHLNGPAVKSLDLGCGAGTNSLALWDAGATLCIEGVDVSRARVAEGEKRRRQAGVPGGLREADVNRVTLPKNTYDVIFSCHSFHHFLELEHVMTQVAGALTPRGLFILEEYVGPTQFQWTNEQMAVTKSLLALLPARLRMFRWNALKTEEGRPTPAEVVAVSPFESIRSAEIGPLFARYFDVVAVRNLGGTIQQLLYNGIAHNFKLDDAEAAAHVRAVAAVEDALIGSGLLPSDFQLLIGRRK